MAIDISQIKAIWHGRNAGDSCLVDIGSTEIHQLNTPYAQLLAVWERYVEGSGR